MANDYTQTAGWLAPEAEQQGLKRYLEIARERLGLIATAVIVTTLAAGLYVALADKRYEAEAKLLVTPVSRDSEALMVLGLLRDSNDPTRDVQTAAQLVTSTDVAQLARRKLGGDRSASDLLADVEAAPVAQSYIVTVTGTGASPESAQRVANAFAEAVIEDRDEEVERQVRVELRGLRDTLERSSGDAAIAVARQIALLDALRAGGDPTLQVDTLAEPGSQSWPRAGLSIFAGGIVGLVLGLGLAFGAELFDPRLRRESQLRARFRLPILARVPAQGRGGGGIVTPELLSEEGVEAYRALRATLESSGGRRGPGIDGPGRDADGRAVVIAGSSAQEGKTTTALNLAVALAHAGRRVVLVEADLRRPALAKALGVDAGRGVAGVLLDELPVSDALVPAPAYGDRLRLLLVDEPREWMADQFALPSGRALLEEARQLADYVVVDAPPMAAVIDALPLAQVADDVLIVARVGKTQLGRLARLGELLAQAGVTPVGIALICGGRVRRLTRGRTQGFDAPRHRDREREPALRSS